TIERVSANSPHRLGGYPASFRVGFRIVRNLAWGSLLVHMPDGRSFLFGTAEPNTDEARGIVWVNDANFMARVFSRGGIGFAEGFMEDAWNTPDLEAVTQVVSRNVDLFSATHGGSRLRRWAFNLLHLLARNSKAGSRRNIAYHYDLGNDFYSAWLDPSMTYSSARYGKDDESLEAAQANKYASLADLLTLEPEHHVLEIGCGWGGFAEYAAREIGCQVTGITISQEQHDFAVARIKRAGLEDKVTIKFCDYRDIEGQFDRVASIEMFEAVGEQYWPTFFDKIDQVLKAGGKAGLQIITVPDKLFQHYKAHTDFIQKYIFPGGMLPSPGALRDNVSKAGLQWLDSVAFRHDYARTLLTWHERFLTAWPRLEPMGFDERFKRMWQFYLCSCAASFRSGNADVIQVSLAKA
ncbi:MAG: cyclopropane-fatty-acyl-phospholipid synthase family protein, partial [Pseudomonadota bacterium]